MEQKKSCQIKKISSAIPGAALHKTSDRLSKLRELVNSSAELGEDLSQVVAQLRQIPAEEGQPFVFTHSLAENERLLRVVFRDCSDVSYRHFMTGNRAAFLVYMDGMVDRSLIEKQVLQTLMGPDKAPNFKATMENLINHLLTVAAMEVATGAKEAIESVMKGQSLLLIDGLSEVLTIHTTKYEKRSIQDALTEEVIRGPHDAFTETITDNIVLIRRRTRDANVKVRIMAIGERTKTDVALLYSANIVKPGLVEEVEQRLKAIKVDKVLSSAIIEEWIIDHPWSPFPQVHSTERPDKVTAAIYEGRVAIIVDNTPFALMVPCTYSNLMQSPEDYTTQPVVSSLTRLTRNLSGFIAIYLPAIYISIVSYHPGMLPTTLAISIAELRARTPFPSLLEAVMMEALLEIFQEAIIRLPKKIAGAAGVVGALVIGTTVVQAGLVNALLVVVIALTAIASYTMPTYNYAMALRFLRVPMLILASVLGLYGVMLGYLFITVHMCSLRSFGESYLGEVFEITLLEDWKDILVRFPHTLLRTRPKGLGAQDRTRAGDSNR